MCYVFETGAYYHGGDGDFFWVDDTALKYKDWKEGEPRWNVNCALMIHRRQWGTDNCTVKRRYICKKEIDYVLGKTRVMQAS